MLWLGAAALFGFLTALLVDRYHRGRIKKKLGQWAQEDRDRVDEINKHLGGRDG